jgi:hypothetical protein
MNWWRKNVILLGMRRDRIITPGTAPKVLMVPLKRGDSCKTWDIPALLSFGGWCHGLQANKMADIKIILNGTCARIVWNNNLSDIALQLPGLLAAASHRKSIHLSSQASSIIHIPWIRMQAEVPSWETIHAEAVALWKGSNDCAHAISPGNLNIKEELGRRVSIKDFAEQEGADLPVAIDGIPKPPRPAPDAAASPLLFPQKRIADFAEETKHLPICLLAPAIARPSGSLLFTSQKVSPSGPNAKRVDAKLDGGGLSAKCVCRESSS